MNNALEFESVSVFYQGNATATVKDFTLRIQPGEKVAFFGLNGSGKTTLLLAAAGLIPFTGKISIDGITVGKKTLVKIRERIGFLFTIPEDQILFPKVIDDVAYGLVRKGVTRRVACEKALAALDVLGISGLAECSPFHLSHGQRQRVALAGTLVTEPVVLLLDEPSSALDPRSRLLLAKTLQSIDAAMLIATHDVDFAAQVCTSHVIIGNGRPIPCKSMENVKKILLGP